MRHAIELQQIIKEIAEKHGLDLTAPEAHLKLTMPNFDPLVIEKIGKNQISVAHYFVQEGDMMADPDLVLFTGYIAWVPTEITQAPFGIYNKVAWLTDDGRQVDRFLPTSQAALADFANEFGRQIRANGWLEHGQRADAGASV